MQLLRRLSEDASPVNSKNIATPIVGAIVAGSVVVTVLLSFCTFFLLRRCKRRRTPKPANQMPIDETRRTLEEMIRESSMRDVTPYSPTLPVLPQRFQRVSKHTISPDASPTSSDEGHGTGLYSHGPFSPLSQFNVIPDLPLPPVPMPSARLSLIPSEISAHNSHQREISRARSMYINRSRKLSIQEVDAGFTLLHTEVQPISILPPAYRFPCATRPLVTRSLSFSDTNALR